MVTVYNRTQENTALQGGNESSSNMSPSIDKTPHKEIIEEKKDTREGGFSPFLDDFLTNFENALPSGKYSNPEGNIKVSEVLGSIARLYERIRTTVEYKGEHVLRRNAIERMLKRLIWEKGSLAPNIETQGIAETLLRELIWARYLKNDSVPKFKITEVQKIIDKYILLLRNLDNLPSNVSVSEARNWIWGVASSEIEDAVDPSNRELYVKLMHDWFFSNFEWRDKGIEEHEKEIQIYLAVHRAFTKSDEAIIRYHLLIKEFPKWNDAEKDDIYFLINNFPRIFDEIEAHVNYKGKLSLYRKLQKHSAAFEIFRTIAQDENLKLKKLVSKRTEFDSKIRDVCEDKYQQIKKKVNTGIIRSIIYIFISKVTFALLLEIPFEIYRYGDIRYLPLFINIGFPPFLMWIIGLSIGIPGVRNTQLIVEKLQSVVYKNENVDKNSFSIEKGVGNKLLSDVFTLLYSLIFLLVFGGISYILIKLNFSFFGLVVFFVFISLVLLFVYRVRFNATQLKVNSSEEDIFSHFFSYLTLPFLNFGFYLSKGLAKLNFFTILLDFLIEAPLKSIIEIFEEWTSFIREKKEQVVEMPD